MCGWEKTVAKHEKAKWKEELRKKSVNGNDYELVIQQSAIQTSTRPNQREKKANTHISAF